MAAGPQLVPGGGDILVDPRRYMRMRGTGMIALAEIVGDELPVGIERDPIPGDAHRRVHRIVAIDVGHGRQIFGEAGPLFGHGVPDETAPCIAAQFPGLALSPGLALRNRFRVLRMYKHAVAPVAPTLQWPGRRSA